MTRRGWEVRRTSASCSSLLAAVLCAGCLNAGPGGPVRRGFCRDRVGRSRGDLEGGRAGGGRHARGHYHRAPRIEGDLAGATDASSRVPFVATPQASGGSGYDADTVLAVRYEVNEDYERAVIDLGTGLEPAGRVPEGLVSQEGNGLLRVTLPSASATCVSDGEIRRWVAREFPRRAPRGEHVHGHLRARFLYRVVELETPHASSSTSSRRDLKAPLPRRAATRSSSSHARTPISDPNGKRLLSTPKPRTSLP